MSKAAFTRMLRRHGEDWSLNAWAASSRDAYEDELPTGELTSTFKAIRDAGQRPLEEQRDEKGQTRWKTIDLLVLEDLALPSTANDTLPVTLTSPEGQIFNLVGVDRSGVPVGAKRLRLASGGADASLYL